MQPLFRKVYHLAGRKDLDKIMVEGLRPLANKRPRELALTDVLFDRVALQLGIDARRAGLFAWPDTKKLDGYLTTDTALFEIDADARQALVLHQAWLDLAWGIMEDVMRRMEKHHPAQRKEWGEDILGRDAAGILALLHEWRISEGCADAVLLQLAELYWTQTVKLADYDPQTAAVLNASVRMHVPQFGGLLVWLPHEVALGTEIIPPERMHTVEPTGSPA